MAADPSAPLWSDRKGYASGPWFASEHEAFKEKGGSIQSGPRCVSHSLSLLTLGAAPPEAFQVDKPAGAHSGVNTQCPISWSAALKPYGKKLAYCATDCRQLKHYVQELAAHDDLFTVSWYIGDFCADPRADGWVCASHITVIAGCLLFNSSDGSAVDIRSEEFAERYGSAHVKRIFRVVPLDYPSEL